MKSKPGGLLISGLLLVALILPLREVRAASFFETMGISIVVGTILGASTLPFYEQPGQHTGNILTGTLAGAAVGLGIVVYGLVKGSDDEHHALDSYGRKFLTASRASPPSYETTPFALNTSVAVDRAPKLLMPLVSLNW